MLKLTGIALSVLLLSVIGVSPYHADAQTQKYLSYENKQYGFSIKYPSTWEKKETLQKDPNSNVVTIVSFAPSQYTSYSVAFSANDQSFKGLNEEQILATMKKQVTEICSRVESVGGTCSDKTATRDTHKNGYTIYATYYAASVTSDEGTKNVAEMTAFIPDGNDIWILQLISYSPTELGQFMKDIGSSLDTFTIFNYEGEQTTTSQPSTVAKSSVGLLQINSGNFAVSKYKPAELIVSGQISNYKQGIPLTLTIVKPDKRVEEQNILVTKDGNFRAPIKIEGSWPAGSYQLSAKYGTQDLGIVSFQVNMGDAKATTPATPKQTTTTSQSKKYLSYDNKKYGFSLKYPSNWEKEEKFEKNVEFPEMLDLVGFSSPSEDATVMMGFIQDDKGTSQKFLDKMKTEGKDAICSTMPAEVICSVKVSEKSLTHKNGYGAKSTTLLVKISDDQTSIEMPVVVTMIPDGKNTWLVLSGMYSLNDPKQLLKDVTSISESFKINNYKGSESQSSTITEPSTTTSPSVTQKQFQLNVKAIQENDLVTITITSPKDSSSDVYGIKLTTTSGKIKNYVKVNGWDHKRINDNTVSYQTKSSPLEQSDVITIKLKVDSKKPEITWNAYSKDQKSLGTGKVKP